MSTIFGQVRHLQALWRSFGPQWLAYRVGYAVRLRTGLVRRQTPITDWDAQPLRQFLSDPSLADAERYRAYRHTQAPRFFFLPQQRPQYARLFTAWDQGDADSVAAAAQIGQGDFSYFSSPPMQVAFPPDWHGNPFTGERVANDRHWSEIDDFTHGDIKVIWELSRFSFVYTLVRAYWRTNEERYAELFWQLVEDWRTHNRPQQGANWKCGQEISLRVMAWCFGLYGFFESAATTPARVSMLAQMIAVSGARVEANLNYALSQRNNHGISEGLGLWTIGTLFPELRAATGWRETGRRVFETQGRALIADDGSFSQHSVNYHRLMLHDYLWGLRLADLHGQPFSVELKERVGKAAFFLYSMQDRDSGQVPYYGQNDGALVLPLNNCGYADFRPVVQAALYYHTGTRCYPDGPWDEDLLWLFGPEAVAAPVRAMLQTDWQAQTGGYYVLRAGDGFTFARCATFHERPGQADMLHVDVWWRGQNMALDAGTYNYNAPAPWNNPLAHTEYHNTVTVDALDQMDRVGKFLWLPWLQSRVRCYGRSPGTLITYWEGEHTGYQRLAAPVSHRRGIVRLSENTWIVLDRLNSQGNHQYRLHWLFPDMPYQWDEGSGRVNLQTPRGSYYAQLATIAGDGAYSLVRADSQSPRGWRAPRYLYREPALSVALTAQARAAWFWTVFGPERNSVRSSEATLTIDAGDWQGIIALPTNDSDPRSLVTTVSVQGRLQDSLEVSSCTSS